MSTVKLTSDTLNGTPTAGEVEYNGQFYATDSSASRAQIQRLVLATSQASTSGTSIDFTSIPSWVKRITVMFDGVSTNGTSTTVVQIGDSGGIETTGYVSGASSCTSAGAANATAFTAGFGTIPSLAATTVQHCVLTITNMTGNTWAALLGYTTSAGTSGGGGGTKTLSATLDRVRITTLGGTDTFDAGSINLLYEG